MKRLKFLIILICLIFGCAQSEPQITKSSSPFFELKSYFIEELQLLKKVKKVHKVVDINGSREEKELNKIDFSKELIAFSDSDINRLAWEDKYLIDSIRDRSDELSGLRYTANNERMRTQLLHISFQKGIVDSIYIHNKVTGFATERSQKMIYLPGKGYSIRSRQNDLFSQERFIFIQVKYLE